MGFGLPAKRVCAGTFGLFMSSIFKPMATFGGNHAGETSTLTDSVPPALQLFQSFDVLAIPNRANCDLGIRISMRSIPIGKPGLG